MSISRRDVLKTAIAAPVVGVNLLEGKAEASTNVSDVYFTKDITPESMMKVISQSSNSIKGNTFIKIHFGEEGNKHYINPELVKPIVATFKASVGDSNVYYGGSRGKTDSHIRVAKEHGYDFCKIDILDSSGTAELPISNSKHNKTALIGKNISNYDSLIVLSHFKGHGIAGFGGAIKNLAMGAATPKGKGIIHGGGWGSGEEFLEKLVEYFSAINDHMKGNIIYINVLNNISIDCDCMRNAKAPTIDDIGIVVSTDVVAIEQASVDLALKSKGSDELKARIDSKKGCHQIKYAEQIGLGSSKYNLIEI